jgi:large subunit ribosomal protein L3
MKYILATKQHMTQVFDEEGRVHPATVLLATPNTVTQVKNAEKDGYTAVQVGAGSRKEKNVNKAQRAKGNFAAMREYRAAEGESIDAEVGKEISVDEVFAVGDTVVVSGTSKAKGFQGTVKRHGFHGGPRTHGQKHNERSPGSIGGGLRARVPKGMRMSGRMGGVQTTVKNLKVIGVDKEKNLLIVEGAVPGRRGTLIEVRGA